MAIHTAEEENVQDLITNISSNVTKPTKMYQATQIIYTYSLKGKYLDSCLEYLFMVSFKSFIIKFYIKGRNLVLMVQVNHKLHHNKV